MSDVEAVLNGLTEPLRNNLKDIEGDHGAAQRAATAFGQANTALADLKGRHNGAFKGAMNGWYGDRANVFQGRVTTLEGSLDKLAANCKTAQDAVNGAYNAVTSAKGNIERLVNELRGAVTPQVQAALAGKAGGNKASVPEAIKQCWCTAANFHLKGTQEITKAKQALGEAAGKLRGLPGVDVGSLGGMGGALGGGVDGTGTAGANGRNGSGGNGSGSSGGGGGSGSGGGGGGGGGGGAPASNLPVAIPPQPGSGVDVNLPGGKTVQAPNEIAAAAVRKALTALGTPYVWAASNPPQGTDCSGLTKWSYAAAGFELPRHSAAQAMGAQVPPGELLPGDLVVWKGHVAMFIGDGQIIEAGDPVQIGKLRTTNSGMPFMGFFRPTG
ncbi:C40 family peptidase [Crossiella sp. CA198]|uniref:C40 family peptidase n=1 Tax=Crossiella sp. CA198 TaxID=3455607 RepID=UPI003F8D71AB